MASATQSVTRDGFNSGIYRVEYNARVGRFELAFKIAQEACERLATDQKMHPADAWHVWNGFYAKHMNCTPKDNNWRWREYARFQDGEYASVPWYDDESGYSDIPGHFLHLSANDPTKVAFTENAKKGAADRQTQMNPGRYLTKFFPDMAPDKVRELAGRLTGVADGLKFAATADEIQHVYESGPSSCMSHKASEYPSPFHPVRVYAAGDLQVAYLERRGGHITDRVLVWPAAKIYGRVYGSQDGVFESLLKQAGYHRGDLSGARLERHTVIKNGREYLVCPYIDDFQSVEDMGDYLTIDGDVEAGATSGLILSEKMLYVSDLDEERRASWVEENCQYSEYDGHWYFSTPLARAITRFGDEYYDVPIDSSDYTFSDVMDMWVHDNQVVPLDNGDVVSKDYFKDNPELWKENPEAVAGSPISLRRHIRENYPEIAASPELAGAVSGPAPTAEAA